MRLIFRLRTHARELPLGRGPANTSLADELAVVMKQEPFEPTTNGKSFRALNTNWIRDGVEAKIRLDHAGTLRLFKTLRAGTYNANKGWGSSSSGTELSDVLTADGHISGTVDIQFVKCTVQRDILEAWAIGHGLDECHGLNLSISISSQVSSGATPASLVQSVACQSHRCCRNLR